MKIVKYKCACGNSWLGIDEPVEDVECTWDYDEPDDDAYHIIKKIKNLTSEEYAQAWADELENANRHDMTDVPMTILVVLETNIKDKKIVKRIMKELYEREIGV